MSSLESRKRQRVARKQRHTDRLNALRESGACCGSCLAFCERLHHPGQMMCGYKSDFHGDVIVTATDLCVDYMPRSKR